MSCALLPGVKYLNLYVYFCYAQLGNSPFMLAILARGRIRSGLTGIIATVVSPVWRMRRTPAWVAAWAAAAAASATTVTRYCICWGVRCACKFLRQQILTRLTVEFMRCHASPHKAAGDIERQRTYLASHMCTMSLPTL